MYGLGYVYNLSKRTSVYTNYASIDNGGNSVLGSRYAVNSGTAVSSGITTAAFKSGETSKGYEFGIRHDF
jgi:predicted porin